jgi:exonuclease SbcD
MRLLHTSDWHVGKRIRGHSRADEHRAVLTEIVDIAEAESVDLIAVAGDLYETAAPTPESEQIVNQTLLALGQRAPVLVVAGNHDNPRRLAAIESLLALGRITLVSEARPPDAGGCVELTVGGVEVRAAMLPFVSQRAIVRSADLMANAGFENAQLYGERLAQVVAALCRPFEPDTVNLVVGHAFVTGGLAGGGERPAHLLDEYGLSAVDFPHTANYVALGHLHRAQHMLGPTAIHYCGSPLQLDFGEQEQVKQVNVVDLEPGIPAKVKAVNLESGRVLRTLTGTVEELRAVAAADTDIGVDTDTGAGTDQRRLQECWLRVRVTEPARAGLADEVRSILGETVVDVRVEAADEQTASRRHRAGRAPHELFADYLAEQNIDDPKLLARFNQLLEESGADGDDAPDPGGEH